MRRHAVFAGGICRQEEADATGQIAGRDAAAHLVRAGQPGDHQAGPPRPTRLRAVPDGKRSSHAPGSASSNSPTSADKFVQAVEPNYNWDARPSVLGRQALSVTASGWDR